MKRHTYLLPLNRMIRICFTALVMLLMSITQASAQSDWVPVRDQSLQIVPGSILDFSSLVPAATPVRQRLIANAQGQWVVEGAPEKPRRFLIGSLGFGVNLGGFPDHALTDTYIKQYRMHGYNMLRLDFVESILMEGRQGDFDYNPEQLDRFFYLVHAIKKNGLYLILNGLSNGNGGYGNIQERWISKKNLHEGVYFDNDKQAHWKKLIQTMLGKTNPYTGQSVLQDPVLAGLILANENNLVFLNRQGAQPWLKPHFTSWLAKKYGGQSQLQQAWGRELKSDETIAKHNINLAKPDAWTSPRMADTQAFFYDTEKSTADWMTAYVRSLGYRGWVTAYNLWHSPAAHASRAQLPWVDMHNYFAHPDYLADGAIRVRQDSMLGTQANYIRELIAARHWGKPFTVTEQGQVFWNPYRRENSLAMPAYAALQNWNGLCQHSGAVDLSYAPTLGRKSIIYPFAVGTDPVARVTETLSALLYLRGDVRTAAHSVGVQFGPQQAFKQSAHLGGIPADISALGLVTGIGLDWQDKTHNEAVATYQALTNFDSTGLTVRHQKTTKADAETTNFGVTLDNWIQQYAEKLIYPARKIATIADERFAARINAMKAIHWLPAHNLTDVQRQIYHSDTGELLLEAEQKRMTVMTPNTEAVVFDQPGVIALKQLTVLAAEQGALVAVSSMDQQPLANSRRMLLMLATDARNSDMQFTDGTESTAHHLGQPPVLIRKNKVKIAFKSPYSSQIKVYSVNLRGERVDAINLKQTQTSIEFELDISRLSHGATTYFEISV